MVGNIDLHDWRCFVENYTDRKSLEETLKKRGIRTDDPPRLYSQFLDSWRLLHLDEIRDVFFQKEAGKVQALSPSNVCIDGVTYEIFGFCHGYDEDGVVSAVEHFKTEISNLAPDEDYLFEENLEEFLGLNWWAQHKRSFRDHYEGRTLWKYALDVLLSPITMLIPMAHDEKSAKADEEYSLYIQHCIPYFNAGDARERHIHWNEITKSSRMRVEKYSSTTSETEKERLVEIENYYAILIGASIHDPRVLPLLRKMSQYVCIPPPIGMVLSHEAIRTDEPFKPLTPWRYLRSLQLPFTRRRTPSERSWLMANKAMAYARENDLITLKLFVGGAHEPEIAYCLEHPEFELSS